MLARAQGHNFKFQRNQRLKIEEGTTCWQLEQMSHSCPPAPPFLLAFHSHAWQFAALIAPLSLQCLQPMPNKCACGADATVSVAELGEALQDAAVAMYPRCPTICTTCFHIILKSALRAPEPMLSALLKT